MKGNRTPYLEARNISVSEVKEQIQSKFRVDRRPVEH